MALTPTIVTEAVGASLDAWMEKNWVNLAISGRPYLHHVESRRKTKRGYAKLKGNVSVKAPGNVGLQTDLRGTMTLATATAVTAEYSFAYYTGRTGIDLGEKDQNLNGAVITDLLQNRLEVVNEDIAEDITTNLFKLAQVSGAPAAFYPSITAASGSIGGLEIGEKWQGNVAYVNHASAPLSNPETGTFEGDMRKDWMTLLSKAGMPDLILMSPSVFEKFETEIAAKVHYVPDEQSAAVGYPAYKFKGATILCEPAMEEESAGTAGKVKGWYCMLDTRKNYPVFRADRPYREEFKSENTWVEGYKVAWGLANCFYALNRCLVRSYRITP
ncbi:MAG: hypothetical protein CMLOHMNK_02027 [Steroidobacteraceae bacterium]|nr:hypothetical protein [Steroidobacteraceae bacterium]